MFFLLSNGIEILSTAAVLLPCFLLLHGCCFRNLCHTLWCYCLALYWGMVYSLVGLPTVQFMTFDVILYLIPFAGFINDLRNSILNIFLFLPMGLLLPLVCSSCRRFRQVLKIGFFTSLGIELAQLFTYRVTDINDLITNTLGTALGYLIYTQLSRQYTVKTQLSSLELATTAVVTVLSMFFLQQTMAGYLFIHFY